MRTGLQQTAGLRQELRVNPRLYQAMDMLYMPMMDLQQHLKQELLSNPFLELLEPEEEENNEEKPAEQEREAQQKEDEVDWEEILLNGFEVGGTREQYEALEYTEPVTVETRNLIDHLREQLQKGIGEQFLLEMLLQVHHGHVQHVHGLVQPRVDPQLLPEAGVLGETGLHATASSRARSRDVRVGPR
jgi:DNA-directed RNA polymerase specialized sigma54-like protein